MSASKKRIDRGRKVASPPETAAIAISLAKLAGWYLFPVTVYEDAAGKRHKVPAVKWKEWATNDPKAIAKAWAGEHSGRWIGVYAGKSGIVTGDLDPAKRDPETGEMRRSGAESVAHAGLELPKTFDYPTHRKGGRHYVYAAPEGVELTIGADVRGPDGEKLHGVDVRAGSGLMLYYGPELTKKPKLAPAPDWLVISRDAPRFNGGSDTAPTATEEAFRERIAGGKPDPETAALTRDVDFPDGAAHDNMLAVVTSLVRLGAQGEPGIGKLLDETRERYVGNHPDRPRDWANALEGSIRRLGLPPVTLELSKAERKAIRRRNDPESDERKAADEKRKSDFKAKKNREAVTRPDAAADVVPAPSSKKLKKPKAGKIEALELDEPDAVMPGDRVLEDGPLAAELSWALRRSWAYSRGYGLMRWRGTRWESAEEHSLVNAVRKLIVEIEVDEHTAAAMRGDNKAIDKARTLLSRNRAVNVARLVVGILAEREPIFDNHPDLLNTPSGVIHLPSGKLKKHRPEYFFTKITGAAYDPKADMSLWLRALESVPAEVREWLQVRFGQAATGYTPGDARMLIFEGAGSNGKTTTVTAPLEALGEYAGQLPERLLLASPGDHPTTLMTLMGIRIGIIEELPEGRSLNVKRLKDTVGTPKITAHKMRQDDVTFKTTHALMVNTNYLPIVAETDHGTWRRLALVRFPYRYVETKADISSKRDRLGDPAILAHFEANADPGVLRWIVEGASKWYANGRRFPKLPKKIKRDTAAWRMDADPILAYVAERIVRDDGFAITAADMAEDFNTWLTRRGHKEWSQQTINSRLQGHVSFDGVERKPVKWSGSVHPSRPSAFNMRPIPKVTTAWRGVRFVDDAARIPSEAELDAATFADLASRASR